MLNCNLYVNVSSIHPWTHIEWFNRTYCWMSTKKIQHKNIIIQPFEHYSSDRRVKGVFVYKMNNECTDESKFFYDAMDKLGIFLNYLAVYCRQGFMEMDNYIYTEKEMNNKEIFNDSRLPIVPPEALSHQYEERNISELVEKSLKKADDFQVSSDFDQKINNTLSLYRVSFFQRNEGVRFILLFTALESLMEDQKSTFNDELIEKIMNAARKICSEERRSADDITKICSHIGRLTKESIKNTIKNTLHKYHITLQGKEVDVNTLYTAKNKFGHGAIKIDKIHRLYIDLEQIIPQLAIKLMENNSK